ncbi:MAG: hypothetical protein ACLUEV_12120 [Alistipes sp.]
MEVIPMMLGAAGRLELDYVDFMLKVISCGSSCWRHVSLALASPQRPGNFIGWSPSRRYDVRRPGIRTC